MRGVARRYFTSQLILPAALCGKIWFRSEIFRSAFCWSQWFSPKITFTKNQKYTIGVVFISLLLASLTKSSTTSTPTQSPSTNPTKKSELNQIIDDEWEYVLKSSPGIWLRLNFKRILFFSKFQLFYFRFLRKET